MLPGFDLSCEGRRKRGESPIASHIATDVDRGQSTLDHMESILDKFGTSFNTLGDTLKDMLEARKKSSGRRL